MRLKVKDQIGNQLLIQEYPKRIISIVPSITELLIDLGLTDYIVGRTKFCIHPQSIVKSVAKIGGTKTPDLEKITKLNPDLIICNKEENRKEDVEYLQQKFHVYVSDINNVDDGLEMIKQIGALTGKDNEAETIIKQIKFPDYAAEGYKKISCLYLIWKNPIMAAGANTYIDDLLRRTGLLNLAPSGSRYPIISEDLLKMLNPKELYLSSEPYPFKEKHVNYFKTMLPNTKVSLIDGEMFSWYGSKMIAASEYITGLKKSYE